VTPAELLAELTALARETGLRVRSAPGGEEGGPLASGVCRVRGELVVVLVAAETEDERSAVLARALRAHAGSALDARWLPPAVRARLDAA
jgi:hypothetical protein